MEPLAAFLTTTRGIRDTARAPASAAASAVSSESAEDQEHSAGNRLPDHAEAALDVERSVHLRHPVQLAAERFDLLLVAVPKRWMMGSLDVDRLLGELGRQGVEDAGLRIR